MARRADQLADVPARRHCPERNRRSDVADALRTSVHVVIRTASRPREPLHVTVVECGAEHVVIAPWGWGRRIALPIDEVRAVTPSTAGTLARVRAIEAAQMKLEALWPQ